MHALTPPPARPAAPLPTRRVRPQSYGAPTPPRRDPAPSRLAYRLNRMWLSPLIRRLVRIGLPAFALCLTLGLVLADADRRAAMSAGIGALVDRVQHRPEFQVRLMRIAGAGDALSQRIRALMPVELPASSFDFDLTALRARIAALDAVAAVDMRIRGGVLEVNVTERQPAVLWRGDAGLVMLDASGHPTDQASGRTAFPDLPLVAGAGADAQIPQALALVDVAGPILPRLRGLEWMGGRRWDVVLDRGQRILLPETDAMRALERAIALDQAEDILARDITHLDMRNPARPTLRLGAAAMTEALRQRGETPIGAE